VTPFQQRDSSNLQQRLPRSPKLVTRRIRRPSKSAGLLHHEMTYCVRMVRPQDS
jgi:hypothetical protein